MKQGALIFDEQTDRYDIRFDLADYYGGLHCGETFDVMVGGRWRPARIEMAENWYLVLLWVALTALLAWGYRRRVREESIFSRGWAYYIGNTVIFAAAAGLSVAGMRGGMTRMTRPITLSNAMLYTADSGKANLILSNPFCILRTIGNAGSVKYRKYFTPEELPQRFTPPCTSPPTARRSISRAAT